MPLTWAERSVWLASMLSANPLSYNAACILAINGALSMQRLVDAFGRALSGAGLLSLRVIAARDGLAWRRDNRGPGAPPIDLREESRSDPLDLLSDIFCAKPIKADGAPLVAIEVLKHRSDQHFVMLRHHHVLLDFQGAAALLHRVAALYSGGDPPEAEDRRAERAAAERAYVDSDDCREDERYWQGRMAGLNPGALSNPALTPSPDSRLDLTISSQAFAAFASEARAIGSTPFQSLLMITYAHLQRRQEGDVIFGVPLASRTAGATSSQSLMLPFRVGLAPDLRGQDAAVAIRLALKADIERSRFPIWENTEAIFPGAVRGGLPRVALNFMRATSLRFGDAGATIARMLYGA